jgi:hypothetical protein
LGNLDQLNLMPNYPMPPMPPATAMLCILVLLPLAESSTPAPAPAMADALADACMAEPEAVARALIEVVRINPTSIITGPKYSQTLLTF